MVYPIIDKSNTDLINNLLLIAREFKKRTNRNILDNYGYREFVQLEELQEVLPSIQTTPSRTGIDAIAPNEGYSNIELKSNAWNPYTKTNKERELTPKRWQACCIDVRADDVLNSLKKFNGFGHSLFHISQDVPVASYFITKEHIEKIHPLFEKLITDFRAKPRKYQTVNFKLIDVLDYIPQQDLILFRNGKRVSKI